MAQQTQQRQGLNVVEGVLILALIGGGYYLWKLNKDAAKNDEVITQVNQQTTQGNVNALAVQQFFKLFYSAFLAAINIHSYNIKGVEVTFSDIISIVKKVTDWNAVINQYKELYKEDLLKDFQYFTSLEEYNVILGYIGLKAPIQSNSNIITVTAAKDLYTYTKYENKLLTGAVLVKKGTVIGYLHKGTNEENGFQIYTGRYLLQVTRKVGQPWVYVYKDEVILK